MCQHVTEHQDREKLHEKIRGGILMRVFSLAIKADLNIPWRKLRMIRRCKDIALRLNLHKVTWMAWVASERKMKVLAAALLQSGLFSPSNKMHTFQFCGRSSMTSLTRAVDMIIIVPC